ncbi:winged helix-turn-helix domain-containing protein [Nostoc sp. CHAB 5834]|nr:winged helix-turn-helix domain-containing protein [Nostoc sp. CHAB 5834]
MNIDKIIAALPGMSNQERDRVRANAEKMSDSGTSTQKVAAGKVITTLNEIEISEHQELVDRLSGLEVSARVVEAFRARPMTETEFKILQVLIDNPGSSSTELSQALGWGGQSWHMHFGTMCANRASYLWPAPKYEDRSKDFYCGILADLSNDYRWTLKSEVVAAFSEFRKTG